MSLVLAMGFPEENPEIEQLLKTDAGFRDFMLNIIGPILVRLSKDAK